MADTLTKIPNVDHPEAWCYRCGNTGWVELRGEVRALGTTYTVGRAPCKWCMLGEKAYKRAIGQPRDKHDHHRPWTPKSDFSDDDIVPIGFEQGKAAKPDAPIIRQLPGMEDEGGLTAADIEQACRRTYTVWRRELGKELADARLRARTGPDGEPLDRPVYPLDTVELIIREADSLDAPVEPAATSEGADEEPI